ncbi:MAG: sensor histidine kinase [Oceanospirillaceae bacterium]|nr:sensor histidine kinase [Oceanospirillaceae bacterium]
MVPLHRFFLLIFFLLFFSNSAFSSPVRLGADIVYKYYEDKSGDLNLEEFLNIPDDELKKSNKILSKGYTGSIFWIKADISDERLKDEEHWLEILPTYLDRIEFYYREVKTSGPWVKKNAGDFNESSGWDFNYHAPLYILPASSKGYSLIFRISTSSSMILNIRIWNQKEFIYHALINNTFWIFFFGVFSLASGVFLLLALVMKKREFWILFFSTTIYFNVFCVQGYFDWMLGQHRFHLQHYFVCFTSITTFSVVLFMCSELLGQRDENKKIYFFIKIILLIMLAQVVFVFFDMYSIAIRIVYSLFLLGSCAILYLCFFSLYKNKINLARFLMVLGVISLLCLGLYRVMILNDFIFIPEGDGYFWQVLVAIIMFFMMGVTMLNVYNKKIQDIERKSLIRELNIERENRFHQRQFISIVSHEFRTSLSIISGAITNLLRFHDNDKQLEKRYKRIERANNRLIQLTDNCLADDRLTSKVESLQLEKQDLCKILLDASDLIYMFDHHSIKFSWNHQLIDPMYLPKLPVNADYAMLQIAFSNIFDNALKYMDEGVLEVDVYEEAGFYLINILDHGTGIDKEKENEIFERYKKITRSGADKKSGVGLGLYVCKNILIGHNGNVVLLHNSNEGCCFQFRIPKLIN